MLQDMTPKLLSGHECLGHARSQSSGSSLDFESVGAPLVGALFGPNHAASTEPPLWNDLGRRCRAGDHKGRPYAFLRSDGFGGLSNSETNVGTCIYMPTFITIRS